MANAVAGFRFYLDKTNHLFLTIKLTTVHNQKNLLFSRRANIEISSDEDDDYSDEVSWVIKTTVLKEKDCTFF